MNLDHLYQLGQVHSLTPRLTLSILHPLLFISSLSLRVTLYKTNDGGRVYGQNRRLTELDHAEPLPVRLEQGTPSPDPRGRRLEEDVGDKVFAVYRGISRLALSP